MATLDFIQLFAVGTTPSGNDTANGGAYFCDDYLAFWCALQTALFPLTETVRMESVAQMSVPFLSAAPRTRQSVDLLSS